MKDALNHVDLCFVVDTTGSMQPFICFLQGFEGDLLNRPQGQEQG